MYGRVRIKAGSQQSLFFGPVDKLVGLYVEKGQSIFCSKIKISVSVWYDTVYVVTDQSTVFVVISGYFSCLLFENLNSATLLQI